MQMIGIQKSPVLWDMALLADQFELQDPETSLLEQSLYLRDKTIPSHI
jgi:hypothetical protein